MRLCFLLERTYAPYAKWFGTAFRRLPCGADLVPILQGVLAGTTWQARERWLCEAYAYVARLHRQLDITPALPQEPRQFFGRPFRVMALHGYADSLRARIADPQVRALAETRLIGSIDLFSDNVDLLEDNELRPMLRTLYETKIQNYRAEQGHA
jgi:hypothetical protein